MTPICDQLIAIAAKCGYRINGNTIQDLLIAFNNAVDNDSKQNQSEKQPTANLSKSSQYKRRQLKDNDED